MNETTLIVLIIGAVIILAVLLYNLYQENRYRKQIRQQFGHSDQDALLDGNRKQVRDSDSSVTGGEQLKPAFGMGKKAMKVSAAHADEAYADNHVQAVAADAETFQTETVGEQKTGAVLPDVKLDAEKAAKPQEKKEKLFASAPASKRDKALFTIKELANIDLPWFDKRFDYMAYVALDEPQELHALPRLSNRHFFRVIGCTMDDHFQLAEPIPSVRYQGFVMGLQGISRVGLVSRDDILAFSDHVQAFAMKMNAQVLLTDADDYLNVAKPLDDLCARVDQMIAMHLVSRESLMGAVIRSALQNIGFELSDDGTFVFADEAGANIFSAVALDGQPFTAAALDNQAYRGFSLLFDVPNVAQGAKAFDQFMDLVVKLSSQLGLDLVDDNLEELSMQSLKDIRRYVISRQEEMSKVGLVPGSDLTRRLFS